MAMILDAFITRCCDLLTDFAYEEVIMVLDVKEELQKLLRTMKRIRCLLQDAEKRKIKESSIDLWLSELKDVMYDADDIIDLCTIKGNQLLAGDENPQNKTSRVCCAFSSTFSSCFFTSVPLRHEIGTRIKELNVRLNQIYENRKQFKLEKFEILETPQITLVNPRQTCSLVDPLVVGGEVEVAANELVNLLITDKVEDKCRIFAVAGMGGIGKTTLAQKIFNHPNMQNSFNSKVWICVSQTYSETELLKQVIRKVNGKYEDANTTSELQPILRDSLASGQSLFVVLDDVWRADVWVKLLRIPLQSANTSVRVLVTTRYEEVATDMKAARTHNVMKLSTDSGWDMLRKLLFSDEEEQLSNELKELGIDIVKRCEGLPLAIKAIAGVLIKRERSTEAWQNILTSDVWSIKDLHDDHIAALQLSFEDLPSHLKQCFLYFSLYGEDASLYRHDIARLWMAEGFIAENINEGSLMEDVAEQYFNELLGRNLLLRVYPDAFEILSLRDGFIDGSARCKMHDLVRSLVIFLSKEETSYGDVNVKSSATFIKLRRLSVAGIKEAEATKIIDLVAKQRALRTLLASNSDLLLNEERLKWLSCLRVLDISDTRIKELPDSIGGLVHLRYLDLRDTEITAIPESFEHLSYLQFLDISGCSGLTRLPNGITKLHNLRYFDMSGTFIRFMPKGIEKLQQLNYLDGFPTDNTDTSSKLEDLNSLKQIRTLGINNLEEAQSEAIILKELPHLSKLTLNFCLEQLASEELFDKIIPPQCLKELYIFGFFGRRFPNWMASSSFENYVPKLTELELQGITSCAQLPSLGQLPELRKIKISDANEVKIIGPEFLGGGVGSTTNITFPKLDKLVINGMRELEEWSFGAQIEDSASPRLKILPCLRQLEITSCPLLKQLPKGLKHERIKSLWIEKADSLKFVEDLPSKVEELHFSSIQHLERVSCLPMLKRLFISECRALERVSCLPMLKQLSILNCRALSCVEKLHTLQELRFWDTNMEGFPEWLLMLLQQQNRRNKQDFLFDLTCHKKVLQMCLEGGSYWELIQQIPRVTVRDYSQRSYIRYNKHPYIYDSKIIDK